MIPREVYERTLRQFFAPIVPFLDDSSVSEIMINGPSEIIIERKGKLSATDARFLDEDELLAAIRHLGQFVGRNVSRERPILEARFPDGSRVEAVLPPASPDGPHVAIRRFAKESLTVDRLIEFGALTHEAAALLEGLVACKQNIIVAGGTGSGKTSMLNALSAFIGHGERVVAIEDARELQLQSDHVVQFEAQAADATGRGKVSIRDLFQATLRLRPDRIVVGEIRGGEALELIQAMTSGHGGCMSTVHATYPKDTLSRLETMALMSDVELPMRALRSQVASAIDFIVQTARLSDGSRGITHIAEVVGLDENNKYEICELYRRTIHGTKDDGRLMTSLDPTGARPQCWEQMVALGMISGGERHE
ncbi:MAG: CpaF family protein [Myxococcales bacterium]|nr:CpaF family protein [Myxococcales bacterium]